MNGKSSISWLQELMMAKHSAPPVYVEESVSDKFKCTVFVKGITAEGFALTKKGAKHESAANALKLLGYSMEPTPQDKSSVQTFKIQNYVGELNEIATSGGHPYANYEFECSTNLGQFICVCTFEDIQRRGTGSNKKEAKQDAARNVLTFIKSEGLSYKNREKLPKHALEDSDNARVIQKFKELSLNNKINAERQTFKTIDCVRDLPQKVTVDHSIMSLSELERAVRNLKIKYTLTQMQIEPRIIIFQINNSNFTLMGSGKTQEDALRQIFTTLLNMKRDGCSLNDDIMNFK